MMPTTVQHYLRHRQTRLRKAGRHLLSPQRVPTMHVPSSPTKISRHPRHLLFIDRSVHPHLLRHRHRPHYPVHHRNLASVSRSTRRSQRMLFHSDRCPRNNYRQLVRSPVRKSRALFLQSRPSLKRGRAYHVTRAPVASDVELFTAPTLVRESSVVACPCNIGVSNAGWSLPFDHTF